MTAPVDVNEYRARQMAKLRTKREMVITDLRTGPWTDAEDAIVSDSDLFLVEKMAMLQRSELDIRNRISTVHGIRVACRNCGESFMSQTKRGVPRSYCSVACSHQGSRSLMPMACNHCQKIFRPYNSSMRYCSKTCVHKSNKLTQISCKNCQQMFTPRQSRLKYCSKSCRFEARRTLKSRPCGYCQNLYRPKTSASRYCSRTCTGKAKTSKHIKEHSKQCPVCELVFVALVRGSGQRNIHCSRSCQKKAVAVSQIACVVCEKKFPRHASKKTCSRECAIAYRVARNAEYRERWRRSCPQCGESFIANAISSHNGVLKRRTFCSKDCAKKANPRWTSNSAEKQPGTGVQVQHTEEKEEEHERSVH